MCQFKTAAGGVGIAVVGRRGMGFSAEMHQLGASVGESSVGAADLGRIGRDPLERFTYWVLR